MGREAKKKVWDLTHELNGATTHGYPEWSFFYLFSFGFYYFLLVGVGRLGENGSWGDGHIHLGTWRKPLLGCSFLPPPLPPNLMDRFSHWDRDKGCIIIIEQRKVDFALQGGWRHRASQRGGKYQKKKGGQRMGDYFS